MNKQSGFAHAVLIIGLVVALVGALGFIFWQNFIHKEPVVTKTETVGVKNPAQEKQTNPNEGFTVLADWNARFPSDSQKYDLTKGSSDESEYYIISSQEVKERCTGSDAYIGTILRYEPNTKLSMYEGMTAREAFADANAKVVTSKYIYIFAGPQSVCSEEVQVQQFLTTNVAKLKARFDKLEEY